ncbi:cyclic nucleotide-binding domain-containing protein [Desulfobacca acetoxidans]|uniref:Putative transcriptional regulator, Crp/Fnr family n=1 Tax=Desulfobacca acetoxidans (strain ATCC 700848 / DSM 11109 / ASRB2) TaxID=880072 RepID=F2NCW3_DESAR|nr:cyclic nucleotide-binding domain-containing protein [Desulfobacca acetoxidans]AEB09537.1 putative transcriptional regulator, Crp/Fnr family [Desulfobacca acetoxidans DSM 11109]
MENLESILASHPFLASLTGQQIQLLAGCATLATYRANEVIFTEGEKAERLFLLRFGRVAVEVHRPRRGPRTIYTLGEGDLLGALGAEAVEEWFFDARTQEVTRAIVFQVDCLRKLFAEHPDLGYELLRRFVQVQAKKIKLLKLQLVDFYGS